MWRKSSWRSFVALFACLMALMMVLPVMGSAEERTDASGRWKYILEDGEATIIGYEGESPGGDLTIPGELDGYAVTGINEWEAVLGYCGSLTSVTIPESLIRGMNAGTFSNSPLKRINVHPDNPKYASIDGVLFDKELKMLLAYPEGGRGDYEVPHGILGIAPSAFESCIGLTGVVIPDGVTSIGNQAFSNSHSLVNVTMPNSITYIGNRAFILCRSLTGVVIPDGITSIGNGTFEGCSNLTSVAIPDSVTNIGNSAFAGCSSLTNVNIPDSVVSIAAQNPFAGCPLVRINVHPDNPQYISIDGVLFDKKLKMLI